MKRHIARKAISVLLTVMMIVSSVYMGLAVIATAALSSEPLPISAELTELASGKVYTVAESTSIGAGGLEVPENTTVYIDIASRSEGAHV